MSDRNLARRAAYSVYFAGVDITRDIRRYVDSITFTDNEEDETDDLQIKLHDRDGLWLEKWLSEAINSAAHNSTYSTIESTETTITSRYKVVAKSGLTVRSRPGEQYQPYGTLPYGKVITVASISGGWANFTYSDKNAYVESKYLKSITVSTAGTAISVGDTVIASGAPRGTAHGNGTAGAVVTKYKGTVSAVNKGNGVPYPYKVGSLGWFAESDVQKTSEYFYDESGLKIQAAIIRQNWKSDGKDEVLECGTFDLDSVVAQGPPSSVTIKGTSLPYSSTVRQTKKSRSWEKYSLSGIADEMAENNGMTCMFLSASDPKYDRVEQYETSDIVFLQKLCRDAGCSLKVSNNIIVVFDQAEIENRKSVKTIRRGSGYLKYKLSTAANDTYTSCRVYYTSVNGKTISATAYVEDYDADNEKNQCLEINQKVTSIAEAMTIARAQLRLHNKYALTAGFTYPGDPTLLAGCAVLLRGWGPWDGKYIISKAVHKISVSGYTTDITLRVALDAGAEIEDDEKISAEDVYNVLDSADVVPVAPIPVSLSYFTDENGNLLTDEDDIYIVDNEED